MAPAPLPACPSLLFLLWLLPRQMIETHYDATQRFRSSSRNNRVNCADVRRDPKTVNHLDERQGNFDSLRGWVCFQTHWRWETQRIQHLIGWWWSPLYDWLTWGCQDPVDPASDWLIVVQALLLADLRVPRVADSKVGCQIAFSWPILAKSSPFI